MKCLWITGTFTSCLLQIVAQDIPSTEFPHYRVYQGILDEDNSPVRGARLCGTEKNAHCFILTPSGAKSEKEGSWSQYGLRTHSRRLKLDGGGSLVLFNANCGGGSGSADRYVLLRSQSDGSFKNLLPNVVVTNRADVAAWNLPTVSPLPVFVTADYLWEGMEAHYSSHFFEVRVYVFDPSLDRYKLHHKYRTAHKYPGIDNWEQAPEILDKERSKIIEQLGAQ